MSSDARGAPGHPLLAATDPDPVACLNPDGASRFVLIGDHAGNAIPAALGDLGVSAADRARHIAIDIGTARLGALLSARLDAPFLSQRYSRLVIDCNRDPARADAMPELSDGTRVPANVALTPAQRDARVAAIHEPYHAAIAALLDARAACGRPTALVSLHSFTPVMRGQARPWHAGILHDAGVKSLSDHMLAALQAEPDLVVGDNEPYRMDVIDHSVPRHAWPRAMPYVELEVRQDLLSDDEGIAAWADRLARLLEAWPG